MSTKKTILISVAGIILSAGIIVVLLLTGCVCFRVPQDDLAQRLIWDKDARRLIVVNNYKFSTVSAIRVDTLSGTLDLTLEVSSMILNRRWAVTGAVELPHGITAIKIDNVAVPLSELQEVEPIREKMRLDEEIVFRPRLYPSTYKFKYYHVNDKW